MEADYGSEPPEDEGWDDPYIFPTGMALEPEAVTATEPTVPAVEPLPERPTIWQVIQSGVIDQRCRLKEVHIHDILHALGLNPNSPWPPHLDEFEEMLNG